MHKVRFVEDVELSDEFWVMCRKEGTTYLFLRSSLRQMPTADMAAVLEEVLAGMRELEDQDQAPAQRSSSATASP